MGKGGTQCVADVCFYLPTYPHPWTPDHHLRSKKGRVQPDVLDVVYYKHMNILYSQKIKAYGGKYLAIHNNKIVAIGRSATEAFNMGKKILGEKKKLEAVYYVPQKKDFLTALCVSPTSS